MLLQYLSFLINVGYNICTTEVQGQYDFFVFWKKLILN